MSNGEPRITREELLASCSGGIPFTGEGVLGISEGRTTRTTRIENQQGRETRLLYLPGKRYYVKEPWWHYASSEIEMAAFVGGTVTRLDDGGHYDANDAFDPTAYPSVWAKRSPMYMPRWAARYVIEILTATPMRLHDITPAQILAEGIDHRFDGEKGIRQHMADAWDAINKDRAPWASNPRVVGYEFRLVAP
jgi:hypothetical protein